MPTQTELEFYKAFGIESNDHYIVKYNNGKNELYSESRDQALKDVLLVGGDMEAHYPPITDRRLLELICVHLQYLGDNFASLELDDLKKEILDDLTREVDKRAGNDDYSLDLYNDVRKIMGVEQ